MFIKEFPEVAASGGQARASVRDHPRFSVSADREGGLGSRPPRIRGPWREAPRLDKHRRLPPLPPPFLPHVRSQLQGRKSQSAASAKGRLHGAALSPSIRMRSETSSSSSSSKTFYPRPLYGSQNGGSRPLNPFPNLLTGLLNPAPPRARPPSPPKPRRMRFMRRALFASLCRRPRAALLSTAHAKQTVSGGEGCVCSGASQNQIPPAQ